MPTSKKNGSFDKFATKTTKAARSNRRLQKLRFN
jgi:hypothetical protein